MAVKRTEYKVGGQGAAESRTGTPSTGYPKQYIPANPATAESLQKILNANAQATGGIGETAASIKSAALAKYLSSSSQGGVNSASVNNSNGTAAATSAAATAATPASAAPAASDPVADYLKQMMAQYSDFPTWQERTPEERRAQAQDEYKSYYDQLRLSSRQNQEFMDLMLQQQKAGLGRTYDKQREASAKQYADAYSRSDRQMLGRGMQRSSYTAQTLANIDLAGAEAQQDIWDQQAEAEGNIDQQRTTLAYQLAQQLSQYDASEARDVLSRIRALEEQDYERGFTSAQYKNQLSSQIYQFLYQAQRDKVADSQWQAQMDYQRERANVSDSQWERTFNENVRQFNVQQAGKDSKGGGGSGSGSGSGSGNGSKNPTTPATPSANGNNPAVNGLDYNGLMNLLNKGGQPSATPAAARNPANLKEDKNPTGQSTQRVNEIAGPVSQTFLNLLNQRAKDEGANVSFQSQILNAWNRK